MQDIIDPATLSKIDHFLERKSRQYPELELLEGQTGWSLNKHLNENGWLDDGENIGEKRQGIWAL